MNHLGSPGNIRLRGLDALVDPGGCPAGELMRRAFVERLFGIALRLQVAAPQGVEALRQGVAVVLQSLDVPSDDRRRRQQALDTGLEPMRHLAQAHRAGQAGAAFEGVQRAHAGCRMATLQRASRPVAKPRGKLWQQFPRLFLEEREQLRIDRIDGVDAAVGVDELATRRRRRAARIDRLAEGLELGQLEAGRRRLHGGGDGSDGVVEPQRRRFASVAGGHYSGRGADAFRGSIGRRLDGRLNGRGLTGRGSIGRG